MPYELRQPGAEPTRFDSEEQAVAAASAALRGNPDLDLEIIDLATGKPCAPGASRSWREELSRRVGF
jgi:hypothetical protein